MYKFLTVLTEQSFVRLTHTQQAVLIAILAAQTPELAYEAGTGDIRITSSRDFLIRHGLVEAGNGQLRITSAGSDMLESNGLIDATGEITDIGTTLISHLEKHKREFMESLIPYRTLKSLE